MNTNNKPKINRNTIPEGFTIPLALVDMMPVIFFSVAFILIGVMIKSVLFLLGSSLCLISGFIKVLWKIIVAKEKINIWWMFVQMRVVMPLGFLIMIIGFIIASCTSDLSLFYSSFRHIPCLIFAILGVIGIIAMIIFSVKLDASDVRSNWIEQICNSFAQFSILLCVLLAMIL